MNAQPLRGHPRRPANGSEPMQSLQLHGDRDLRLEDVAEPAAPGPGEVQIRVRAVGLNFIDVWGFRGMAFAKRKLPLAVGAEASGEIVCVGEGVTGLAEGDRVVLGDASAKDPAQPMRGGGRPPMRM